VRRFLGGPEGCRESRKEGSGADALDMAGGVVTGDSHSLILAILRPRRSGIHFSSGYVELQLG
jgi:hypothetical protein